jgi:protoheme IX farnesyltransferase
MNATIHAYFTLTKPTIMLLVLFTSLTALVIEGSMLDQPGRLLLVLLGIYLTGGCANALNQFFEREIDARMERTKLRRPLPLHSLTPGAALTFAVIIGAMGVFILAFWFNWLAALLSLLTILFYSLIYTLLLKPNTTQNIVLGGVAGAMAPVGAWAAAAGTTPVIPWLLFLIVFLWTPPHFWALAMAYKDDYIKARLPMLPVVAGDDTTLKWIIGYSWLLVFVSLMLPLFVGNWIYFLSALALGGWLLKCCFAAWSDRSETVLKGLFFYSILYLFGLFLALILDVLLLGSA